MLTARLSPTVWVTVEKISQQGVGLLLFAVMAPILGPRAYGLFALVMVLIGFCELVIVEAATEAVICVEHPTDRHLATANVGALAAAVLAALASVAIAPWIADFYGEPELGPLFRLLAALPVISALNAVPIAVLSRERHFRTLALRSILGIFIGGGAGLALALTGAGVWALAVQALVQRAVEMIVLWSGSGTKFHLGWSGPHAKDLAHYARSVFLSRSMNWIGSQSPRLIVGKLLGTEALGLLTLGWRLLDILIQLAVLPRCRVARLEFTRYRTDRTGLDAAFVELLREIAFLALPLCLGGAAILPSLFAVWLDARWQGGVLPAQLLLVTAAILAIYYGCASLLLALGRADREALISTVQTISSILLISVAAPFGLTAAVAALAGGWLVLLPIPLLLARAEGGAKPLALAARLAPLLLAAGVMGVVTYLIGDMLMPRLGPAAILVIQLLVGIALYASLVLVLAGDLARRTWKQLGALPVLGRLFA